MLNLEEYWKVLELTPDASIEEIKLAYRRLVRRWHPDLYPHDSVLKTNAEENIKKINIAYEKLLEYKDQQCQAISDSTTSSSGDLSVQTRATGAVEFYNLGCQYAKKQCYQEAIANFTTAIRLNPNYVEAYRHRGFIYSVLGLELSATADLKKAKALELKAQFQNTESAPNARSNARDESSSASQLQTWRCTQILGASHNGFTTMALSPNQLILATGHCDGKILFWNLKSKQCFHEVQAHRSRVQSLTWSYDGERLASAAASGNIKIWHSRTGSLLQTLASYQESTISLAFPHNCSHLLSGSQNGIIRLWNLSKKSGGRPICQHKRGLRALTTTSDGKLVISIGQDSIVYIQQANTGELLHRFKVSSNPVSALTVAPDNLRIITASQNGQICIWLITGELDRQWITNSLFIRSVAISQSHNILAFGNHQGSIELWSIPSQSLVGILAGHESAITGLIYSEKHHVWLSSSDDGTLRLWELLNSVESTF